MPNPASPPPASPVSMELPEEIERATNEAILAECGSRRICSVNGRVTKDIRCGPCERKALETALSRLREDWQPIATAPKDGRWCVFTSTWNKYARWVGQFERGSWMDQFECESDLAEFTHWMPLPEPPALSSPAPTEEG